MQFDKFLINSILNGFGQGNEMSTHALSYSDDFFTGDENRPTLRKYLRHCESKGYLINHKNTRNQHTWEITQEGKEVRALFNTDHFIKKWWNSL